MAIIGEELEGYVINQINRRQSLHGSGVNTEIRSDNQLNVLNSNTSWIKLASGVSITKDSRLTEIGFTQTEVEANRKMGLAKNNILFGGTAKLSSTVVEGKSYDKLQQRDGFLPRDPNSSYTYGSYGFSPMPGIESADVKTLNRGSIKKATVKLKANNKQQFEILDLLYMRLGYTVLLEWGNSLFIDNKYGAKTILRNTLVEELFFEKGGKGSYLDLLSPIEDKRAEYSGNYDGMLGKVSNFNWTFNVDGSYDIELTIISLGDVIESLKTNLSVDKNTLEFLQSTQNATPSTTTDETPPTPDVLEENKSSNTIASMLYIWKYLNNAEPRGQRILLETSEPKTFDIASFLSNEDQTENLTTTNKTFIFTISGKSGLSNKKLQNLSETKNLQLTRTFNFTPEQLENDAISKTIKDIKKEYKSNGFDSSLLDTSYIKISYALVDTATSTIKNPLINAEPKSAFRLESKEKQFYLRFGYLLKYISQNILPKIKIGDAHNSNPSIFEIDYDDWDNHMYSLPNQISLDPRVCLVRNSNFNSGRGNTQVLQQLPYFREIDNGESESSTNAAYPMNIYLNFNFIIECLKSDEKGDVNIFEFLSAICTGLNKALGGINNLEPIIEEESNTLKIIDTTPIPGYSNKPLKTPYTLQLYGYNKNSQNYISNFVRNVDLKTAITPEFATMITVGATAGGYVKGTEATAFSKWNTGLTDRFKEEFTPGNIASVKKSNEEDEAEVNYVSEFLVNGYVTRYGLTSLTGDFNLNSDAIERNISIVTEYYKYIIAKEALDQDTSGGTVGFIPFKLGITLDGISGIKIYNKLEVNTEFLPKAYGKTVDLIVTGVSHNLSNNDWQTQIETTVIPKTGKQSVLEIPASVIQESVKNVDAIVKGKVPESKKNIITKIVELAKKNGITDRERLTCILAVAGGETQWNPGKSESFSYSLSRAREVFGTRIPKNDKTALTYIPTSKGGSGSQEKLANLLYGGRYGNASNEGWKYRGRGMTQITFKGNYSNVQNNLISKYFPEKGNIVDNPDLVNNTDVSVAILVYGKINGFFGDKLVKGDKAYLSNPVRVQATQNGSNGKGKRERNSVTKNYESAIYAINNTPWVQELIN
jgi:predicted chitinase